MGGVGAGEGGVFGGRGVRERGFERRRAGLNVASGTIGVGGAVVRGMRWGVLWEEG